jgi:two-component system response regulator VanR
MANLLMIEDETDTNEAVCEYLSAAGHTTFSAHGGERDL